MSSGAVSDTRSFGYNATEQRCAMNDAHDNPFPGMNPWLELHWGSTHLRLIVYTADTLNECLPDDLVARIESPDAGERYIQILDSARQHPVTVIQFFSPEIRDSEEHRKAYRLRAKRLLALGSSLVEVDLVRDR